MKNRHRERFDTTVNAHIERCFVATDHKFIECDGIDARAPALLISRLVSWGIEG
ncbi:hypothetical protein KST_00842 [Mycobacterium marinum]|nr:hypothetical protein KST_00842 [Mycobacterium marinum]